MNLLTDAQLWAAVIAFFTPLATATVQQPTWSNPLRTAVASLVATGAGVGTAYFAGDFSGRSIVSSVLLALVVSTTSYTSIFKPSGVAPAIERATSFGARR